MAAVVGCWRQRCGSTSTSTPASQRAATAPPCSSRPSPMGLLLNSFLSPSGWSLPSSIYYVNLVEIFLLFKIVRRAGLHKLWDSLLCPSFYLIIYTCSSTCYGCLLAVALVRMTSLNQDHLQILEHCYQDLFFSVLCNVGLAINCSIHSSWGIWNRSYLLKNLQSSWFTSGKFSGCFSFCTLAQKVVNFCLDEFNS